MTDQQYAWDDAHQILFRDIAPRCILCNDLRMLSNVSNYMCICFRAFAICLSVQFFDNDNMQAHILPSTYALWNSVIDILRIGQLVGKLFYGEYSINA
jgi:hypothetical protein